MALLLAGSLVAAVLAGIGWTLLRAPSTGSADRVTWVITREGLVRFEGKATLQVPWQDLQRLAIEVEHADVLLRPGAALRQPSNGLHQGPLSSRSIIRAEEVEGSLVAFVEQVTRALHDPSLQRGFPTFEHPEGPPEVILADIDHGRPVEGEPMFQRDLKTLCSGLDPEAHADELKLLASARVIDDLAWLAETDGGWLTKGRKSSKVRLVRHGTGTFLVVKYDDGWSTTLSKAPFREK